MYHKWLQNMQHCGIAQELAGVLEVCVVPVPICVSLFTSCTPISHPRGANEGEPQGNGADCGKLKSMKMALVLY